MNHMSASPRALKELFALLSSIENVRESEMLLRDILTPKELRDIAERWQLIRALDSGMTQRDVAKKCGVSISKITRGSHEMQYGTGGFRHFLEKRKRKK